HLAAGHRLVVAVTRRGFLPPYQFRPERNGQGGQIARWRAMGKDRGEAVIRQAGPQLQKRQNALFHLSLQPVERTFRTYSEQRFAQARIAVLQTGKNPASLRNRLRRQRKRRKIAA